MPDMRLHIVSLPNTSTTREYSWSPYTQKVRNFSKMMIELGHETFIYGGPENDAICTEHIPCITKEQQDGWFPDKFPSFDPGSPGRAHFLNIANLMMFDRMIDEHDVICLTEGSVQLGTVMSFPLNTCIEIGVGYSATCTERRVFESYSWMHTVYAKQPERKSYFLDTVIPNAYDINDFPLGNHSEDYMLYVGRLDIRKGIEVAIDVAREIGCKLVVAGEGDYPLPNDVEYVGHVNIEQRAELMGNARCLIAPTLTIEPFGGTVVEAQLCGTPVLTTDWGGFVDTVLDGKTGYRCRALSEFVYGFKHLDELEDHQWIRENAHDQYSTCALKGVWAYYLSRVVGTPGPPHPPGSPQIPSITP